MKRAKSSSKPTRVMPKRGKWKNEPSISEHGEEHDSDKGHGKLARVTDDGNLTSSRSMSPQNAAASGRESPELNCSICLSSVENRAFTDACYHTFCFECLVEWSRVRAVCPLCKKAFHSIIHSFRSYDNYKLYQVPDNTMTNFVNLTTGRSSHIMSPVDLVSAPVPVRYFVSPVDVTNPSRNDQLLAFRRRVYTNSDEMQLRGLWSSDGVVMTSPLPISPAMFDLYPIMLERVRPWVQRDVGIIIGNSSSDVLLITNIVLDLLRHFPICSEDFNVRLFPYLGMHTRRFLLELDSFARTPFDMTTYDARVVYSSDPATYSPPHVEHISSSDDSDVEIVSPAVVPSNSEMFSRNITRSETDMLRSLQRLQQNFVSSFSHRHRERTDWDSPVPGPSGLGPSGLAENCDSGESHTSRSHVSDEQQSPLILSDAESDVVVVDVDQSPLSPINISSGEDDIAAREVKIRRRHKRRKRSRSRKHRGNHFQNDDLKDNKLRVFSPLSSDQNATSVERSMDSSVHFCEYGDKKVSLNSEKDEPLSQIDQNKTMIASLASSASRCCTPIVCSQSDNQTVLTSAEHGISAEYPKRSRSASCIVSCPAILSESCTSKVKPVTCKKHVSGHKSSKLKRHDTDTCVSENFGDKTEKTSVVDSSVADVVSDIIRRCVDDACVSSATLGAEAMSVIQSATCDHAAMQSLDPQLEPSTHCSAMMSCSHSFLPELDEFHGGSGLSSVKITFHDLADDYSHTSVGCKSELGNVASLDCFASSVATDNTAIDTDGGDDDDRVSQSIVKSTTEAISYCDTSNSKLHVDSMVTNTELLSDADSLGAANNTAENISDFSPSSSNHVQSCNSCSHNDCSDTNFPSTSILQHEDLHMSGCSDADDDAAAVIVSVENVEVCSKSCDADANRASAVASVCSSESIDCTASSSSRQCTDSSWSDGLVIDFSSARDSADQSDDSGTEKFAGLETSDSDSDVEWLDSPSPRVSNRQRCISISSDESSVLYSPCSSFHDLRPVDLSDSENSELFDASTFIEVCHPENCPEVSSACMKIDSDKVPANSELSVPSPGSSSTSISDTELPCSQSNEDMLTQSQLSSARGHCDNVNDLFNDTVTVSMSSEATASEESVLHNTSGLDLEASKSQEITTPNPDVRDREIDCEYSVCLNEYSADRDNTI